jgi:hypothetical protein
MSTENSRSIPGRALDAFKLSTGATALFVAMTLAGCAQWPVPESHRQAVGTYLTESRTLAATCVASPRDAPSTQAVPGCDANAIKAIEADYRKAAVALHHERGSTYYLSMYHELWLEIVHEPHNAMESGARAPETSSELEQLDEIARKLR